ncbi:MAG: glycoside hydrolase family 127 protein [Clostridia bacterium]|nr:glycoside hydrolase family 127 protein [Clostridia bacterium]
MAKEKRQLTRVPLGAIKADGWLKKELVQLRELQRNLPKAMEELSLKSAWFGGQGDAWDLPPKYLASLITLYSVLGDETLETETMRFASAILRSQNEDGNFGPMRHNDLLPRIEAVKAIVLYFELTGDKDAIVFLKKYFKFQFNELDKIPCWYKTRARLLDELGGIELVSDETASSVFCDLAEKLKYRSVDWFKLFNNFIYKKSTENYVSRSSARRALATVLRYEKRMNSNKRFRQPDPKTAQKRAEKRVNTILSETDGTNMAKALKYPLIYGRLMGDDLLKECTTKQIQNLLKFHGTALGMFSCDDNLAGTNPMRAIKLDSVVEYLESLTEILTSTGDLAIADLIELVAFNAVPAGVTETASGVQEIGQVNQIKSSRTKEFFFARHKNGNKYSSKNFSYGAVAAIRALPLFATNLCHKNGDDLCFLTYAPCTIDLDVLGEKLKIREITDYPFRNKIDFKVEEVTGAPELVLNFRVPHYTSAKLFVNEVFISEGKSGMLSVKHKLKKDDIVSIKLEIPLTEVTNPDGSVSLRKGSILLASKLNPIIEATDGTLPKCNFKMYLDTVWQYAPLAFHKIVEQEEVKANEIDSHAFNVAAPPFEVYVRCKNVLNWKCDEQGYGNIPKRPKFSEETPLRVFVPYGATYLRIAQFPPCNKI